MGNVAHCPLYGRCLLFRVSAKRGSTVDTAKHEKSNWVEKMAKYSRRNDIPPFANIGQGYRHTFLIISFLNTIDDVLFQ